MSYYKDFIAFIWHQLVDSEWHPAKEMCWFFAHGAVMLVWGSSSQRLCLFIFGWMVGWGGGVGEGGVVGGVMMNENLLHVQRGSDQCHPIVPLWQSGRIAVSLPAQWQARLSWEWREALFCHAKSLKPSSFRLGKPQYCVTASAAERWQSQYQRTHGPGSSELRRATAPKTSRRTAPLFDSVRKGPKTGNYKGVFHPSSHSVRTWPFAQCHHDHLLVAQCTAVSLLPTDLPDPDEWQLPVSLSQLTVSLMNFHRVRAHPQQHRDARVWFCFRAAFLPDNGVSFLFIKRRFWYEFP